MTYLASPYSHPDPAVRLARFEAAVTGQGNATVVDLDQAAAAVTAAIHPQALGWWMLAVLAAIATVVRMS